MFGTKWVWIILPTSTELGFIERCCVGTQKKNKTGLTFLACFNADGSKNMPLRTIGSALNPRVFEKQFGQQSGFDSSAIKEAQMNMNLFHEWLKHLGLYMVGQQGRKVQLLIYNCSAHGTPETLSTLHDVKIEIHPPNTTNKIQSLEAEKIAWLKPKHSRRLLFWVFDNMKWEGSQFITLAS